MEGSTYKLLYLASTHLVTKGSTPPSWPREFNEEVAYQLRKRRKEIWYIPRCDALACHVSTEVIGILQHNIVVCGICHMTVIDVKHSIRK